MAKHDETITLTESELTLRIAAAVAAALATAQPKMTPDEEVAAKLARDRPRGEPPTLVPCISRVEYGGTGSSYLAIVVRGRVTSLCHHARPAGWEKSLPEGMVLLNKDGTQTPSAKQHLYETYYKRDLWTVGKPLNPAYPMTPEEAATYHFGPVPTGTGVGSSASEPE